MFCKQIYLVHFAVCFRVCVCCNPCGAALKKTLDWETTRGSSAAAARREASVVLLCGFLFFHSGAVLQFDVLLAARL